jgi:glycosyltransferase involved in cell wall biosynthesis
LVNALQRKAAVIVQKSVKEGFGLTVTEAMWKEAAVVGSQVGGIRHQIRDGQNGFLVSSIAQCAERIVRLLRDPYCASVWDELREKLSRSTSYCLACWNNTSTCFSHSKPSID